MCPSPLAPAAAAPVPAVAAVHQSCSGLRETLSFLPSQSVEEGWKQAWTPISELFLVSERGVHRKTSQNIAKLTGYAFWKQKSAMYAT